jgi:hypothetical protein
MTSHSWVRLLTKKYFASHGSVTIFSIWRLKLNSDIFSDWIHKCMYNVSTFMKNLHYLCYFWKGCHSGNQSVDGWIMLEKIFEIWGVRMEIEWITLFIKGFLQHVFIAINFKSEQKVKRNKDNVVSRTSTIRWSCVCDTEILLHSENWKNSKQYITLTDLILLFICNLFNNTFSVAQTI